MSSEGRGLSKWQVAALGVGAAAIVAGGAIVTYACVKRRSSRRQKRSDPTPRATPQTQSTGEGSGTGGQSETPAASQPASEQLGALERARAIKQQGNDFFKQQKFEEAIRCYQEAIKVCPTEKKEDMAIFHQNIGAVYDQMASKTTDKDQKTSHLQSVVESCSASLTLNPRYVKAITRRMKAQHSLGNNQEALMDITRACLLDETQGKLFAEILPGILKEIGRQKAKEMFPKLGPLPPTRNMVRSYFESLEWNDDLSEARLRALWVQRVPKPTEKPEQPENGQSAAVESEEAQTAAEGDAESANGSGNQGDEPEVDLYEGFDEEPFVQAAAQFNTENYHGVLELLTEAINRGQAVFVPHALLLRGTLYAMWREDEKGLKDLQDLVNTSGVDKQLCVSALVRRAGIFAGCGELEKTKTCFEKALAIDSNAADIYIHRARVCLEAAEDPTLLSTSINDLERALKMCPNSAHAAYSLASAYHRLASLTQSVQTLEMSKAKFEEAKGRFPNFADGLILHSMFLQDFSQFGEAEELLKKAAKLQPDNPLCHFSLGLLYIVKNGHIEDGVRYMEKAIEVDCSCVQAYDTLAAFEMQKGNMEQAIEIYTKAMKNCRSLVEMTQIITSKEVVEAQNRACQEYGISVRDLANSRAMAMPTM